MMTRFDEVLATIPHSKTMEINGTQRVYVFTESDRVSAAREIIQREEDAKRPMLRAIAAHRVAWKRFQQAPADSRHPDTLAAEKAEGEALDALLRTVPATVEEIDALRRHLDWFCVEEADRREHEPQAFVMHAVLNLASAGRAAA